MSCGSSSYPSEVDDQISQLRVGDQIVILAGDGYPTSTRDRIDIVWKKNDLLVVTSGGIIFGNHNMSKVVRTGQRFTDFLADDKAKAIWKEMVDNTEPNYFDSEPE